MVKKQFDYSKLRGRIVEKFGTLKTFAEFAGVNRPNLTNKMQGHTPFKTSEIYEMCKMLEISQDEIGVYFFTPKVSRSETHGTDS